MSSRPSAHYHEYDFDGEVLDSKPNQYILNSEFPALQFYTCEHYLTNINKQKKSTTHPAVYLQYRCNACCTVRFVCRHTVGLFHCIHESVTQTHTVQWVHNIHADQPRHPTCVCVFFFFTWTKKKLPELVGLAPQYAEVSVVIVYHIVRVCPPLFTQHD